MKPKTTTAEIGRGGIGRVENVVLGAFFIVLVQNGMNLAQVSSYMQMVLLGVLLRSVQAAILAHVMHPGDVLMIEAGGRLGLVLEPEASFRVGGLVLSPGEFDMPPDEDIYLVDAAGGALRFQGHWGFQYYMQAGGAVLGSVNLRVRDVLEYLGERSRMIRLDMIHQNVLDLLQLGDLLMQLLGAVAELPV